MSKFKGFTSVELTKPARSTFDLSHTKRMTVAPGYLYPVLVQECIPSDTFHGSTELLARLAPLLAPIYDQLMITVHYFFVPNRLLWEEWEEFITGGRLGVGIDPVNAPIPPFVDIGAIMTEASTTFDEGYLSDYLGVPIFSSIDGTEGAYDGINLDMMPFLAYRLIHEEYYRDRNFVSDAVLEEFPHPSGEMTVAGGVMKYFDRMTRIYQHEYFTSALPFTQRGTEVLMPLAGTGSVTYLTESFIKKGDGTNFAVDNYAGGIAAASGLYAYDKATGNAITGARIENIDEVTLDASAVSINDFRSAYALQVWLERNAIGGSRYTESTQAHFGVKPQDSRLQRPEFIGGGKVPIKISEVVATAWSVNDETTDVPQGNLAGHGITYGDTNKFHYFCVEHGFIMGILSIMAPPSYHQGLPRMFRRRSFLDYPWSTFAKLGEQPVNDCEIYADPAALTEDEDGDLPLFGYQSRYADWKYVPNTNHGEFHSSLLFWTATRDFSSTPVLGETFLKFDQTTVNRMFAVDSAGNNFWLYLHNHVTVQRALPYYGKPNTLGF